MAEVYVDLSRPASRLLALAGLGAGESVLDVGCGPGTVAAVAAEAVGASGRVVGIDLAPGMLARARELSDRLPNVSILPMDAKALGFAPASFDSVVANSVVQFTGPASLLEWKRVLRPGGKLACSFPHGPQVWFELCRRFVERTAEPFRSDMRGQLAASLVVPDPEAARSRLGFDTVAIDVEEVVRRYDSAEEAFADEYRHGARLFLEQLPPDALTAFKAAYVEAVTVGGRAELPFEFHFWCFS